ncbi:hypothetical protein Tco_0342677, partial [Tanacetum coccineum]
MQVGLSARIEHGKQGRRLEALVAYNPSAEEDYNTALRVLRGVEFSLLADLKSNKDASTETVMNLLRLSDPLANLPGMSDLQPDVEQLMVPIHRPEDQVVLGASSLTFSLSVSHDRVERIRRNIAEHSVTPPDRPWTEYVSEGVTLLSISSTKHKERPLRV